MVYYVQNYIPYNIYRETSGLKLYYKKSYPVQENRYYKIHSWRWSFILFIQLIWSVSKGTVKKYVKETTSYWIPYNNNRIYTFMLLLLCLDSQRRKALLKYGASKCGISSILHTMLNICHNIIFKSNLFELQRCV